MTPSASTWSPCASTTSSCRAPSRCSFSIISRPGSSRSSRRRAVIAGIAEGCRAAGCALVGGETAEMPGLYAAGDYDLAGFAVGAAERGRLLPRGVAPGDVVLGLAEHRRAFQRVLPGPPHRRRGRRSAGRRRRRSRPSETLGEALLAPTRLYVRPLLALHRAGLLKAAAHITGGGLPGNLPRVLPEGRRGRDRRRARGRCRRCFAWLARDRRGRRRPRCCGCSIAASAWSRWSPTPAAARAVLGDDIVYDIGHIIAAPGPADGPHRPARRLAAHEAPDGGADQRPRLQPRRPARRGEGPMPTRPRSCWCCPTARGAPGLAHARAAGVACAVIDHRPFGGDRAAHEAAMIAALDARRHRTRLPRRLHAPA